MKTNKTTFRVLAAVLSILLIVTFVMILTTANLGVFFSICGTLFGFLCFVDLCLIAESL
jgi:uncharacterized membrane protein